jgi:hypothetical protein
MRVTLAFAVVAMSAGTPVAAVKVTLWATLANAKVTVVPDATVIEAGRKASDAAASTVFAGGGVFVGLVE